MSLTTPSTGTFFFVKDSPSVVTLPFTTEGSPTTGLEASDIQCFIVKNGNTPPSSYDLASHLTEISDTDVPGLYAVEIEASILDEEGEIILHFSEDSSIDPSLSFDTYHIRGQVYSKDLSFIGDTVEVIEAQHTNSVMPALNTIESNTDEMLPEVKRLLGLAQENYKISNHTYDTENNLVSAEIKIYPSATDLEDDVNEIATYEMNASYDGQNRLESYEVTKS